MIRTHDDDQLNADAERIAKLTGETAAEVRARVPDKVLAETPRSLSKQIPRLLKSSAVGGGVIDGMAYVDLADGRRFFGHPSQPSHVRQWRLLSGLLPAELPGEAFLCALDVAMRYEHDVSVPIDMLPSGRGVVLEVGAYIGHKAVRMMEHVPDGSRYIGVELHPDNIELLRRNVSTVCGPDHISLHNCGVWDSDGEMEIFGKGRQRNALAPPDNKALDEALGVTVPVYTLDSLLAAELASGEVVDFMYMSINGAEPEALRGLDRFATRIRAMRIITPYQRDGVKVHDEVRSRVEALGFDLDERTFERSVFATRTI